MKRQIVLYLKGVAMGAADAVPGVSGGTIALISGIYEELVGAIRSFDLSALRKLAARDLGGFWRHVNGRFLAVLLCGIGSAVLLFSRVILFCLTHYPELLWSFFFGLIVASTMTVGRTVGKWDGRVITAALLGAVAGYAVTVAVPAETPESMGFVFLSGMIAICAMILPGISGSFILVLLSKYEYIFKAIRAFDLTILTVFGAGCAIGILSFSHLLNWTLKRYHAVTIAALTGLMVGSLNKVWPWKIALETYTTAKGVVKPLIEQNVLPGGYLEITGRDPQIGAAVGLACLGFFLVYLLDRSVRRGRETTVDAA